MNQQLVSRVKQMEYQLIFRLLSLTTCDIEFTTIFKGV